MAKIKPTKMVKITYPRKLNLLKISRYTVLHPYPDFNDEVRNGKEASTGSLAHQRLTITHATLKSWEWAHAGLGTRLLYCISEMLGMGPCRPGDETTILYSIPLVWLSVECHWSPVG